MTWRLSWRADPAARAIADRHYNRQKAGAAQFVPPGRCLVLRAPGAAWVTSWPFPEHVKHAWPGAWINSLFRRESGPLASDLIREAVAATRWKWPEAEAWWKDHPWEPIETLPEGVHGPLQHRYLASGMVTFVDADKVRPKRDPGRCYRRAGFKHVGFTAGGLWAFQMLPAEMPPAAPASGMQMDELLAGAAPKTKETP